MTNKPDKQKLIPDTHQIPSQDSKTMLPANFTVFPLPNYNLFFKAYLQYKFPEKVFVGWEV